MKLINNNFSKYNSSLKSFVEIIDLAKIEEVNKNFDQAIRLYSLAISRREEENSFIFTSPWLLRGKLNLRLRKYRNAKYDLGVYISKCKENMKEIYIGYFYRCIANLKTKNEHEYYNDWSYIMTSQSYAEIFFLRGLKYSLRNEKGKALDEFEKVIKNSPNFFKKNDDLIFHVPGELKAIFNLYSL